MLTPHLKRRVVFAACMAVITGSLTSTFNILRSHGFTPDFLTLWLHAIEVVYPTIMFCILMIAPHVQASINRLIPDSNETTG